MSSQELCSVPESAQRITANVDPRQSVREDASSREVLEVNHEVFRFLVAPEQLEHLVACDAFAEVEEQLVLLQSDLDVAGEFQSVAAFVARLEILLGLQLEQALKLCDIKGFLLLDSFEAKGKVLLIRVRIQIGHGLLRSAPERSRERVRPRTTLFLLSAAGSGACILFLSVLYSVEIFPFD
jgi:hypothetical protein